MADFVGTRARARPLLAHQRVDRRTQHIVLSALVPLDLSEAAQPPRNGSHSPSCRCHARRPETRKDGQGLGGAAERARAAAVDAAFVSSMYTSPVMRVAPSLDASRPSIMPHAACASGLPHRGDSRCGVEIRIERRLSRPVPILPHHVRRAGADWAAQRARGVCGFVKVSNRVSPKRATTN